jgi:hypothetical protein
MVKVMGVSSYFSCFPDYAGMAAAYVGCDFCFAIVDAVFGCCRVFSYHWSLVFQSGASDVFWNFGGDVTTGLPMYTLP